jgi:hypothetical protein
MMCFKEEGPLSLHMKKVAGCIMLSQVGAYSDWTIPTGIGKLFSKISTAVLSEDTSFRIAARGVIRRPVMNQISLSDLKIYAKENRPYFNILNEVDAKAVDVSPSAIRDALKMGSFKLYLSQHNKETMNIDHPIPFVTVSKEKIAFENNLMIIIKKNDYVKKLCRNIKFR